MRRIVFNYLTIVFPPFLQFLVGFFVNPMCLWLGVERSCFTWLWRQETHWVDVIKLELFSVTVTSTGKSTHRFFSLLEAGCLGPTETQDQKKPEQICRQYCNVYFAQLCRRGSLAKIMSTSYSTSKSIEKFLFLHTENILLFIPLWHFQEIKPQFYNIFIMLSSYLLLGLFVNSFSLIVLLSSLNILSVIY